MKPSQPNSPASPMTAPRPRNGHAETPTGHFKPLSSRQWLRLLTLIQKRRSRRVGMVIVGGLGLALALSNTSPIAAQVRPLGASMIADKTPADLRTTLGDCPAELLRDAWTEMLPLEAAAVEREVLALCTERAEAMAKFLAAQAELDTSLRLARAVPTTTESAIPAPIQAVRAEVAGLRSRIARLESGPELPETAANLARLREQLVAAESKLRDAQAAPAGDESDTETAVAAAADVIPATAAIEVEPVAAPPRAVETDLLAVPPAAEAPIPLTTVPVVLADPLPIDETELIPVSAAEVLIRAEEWSVVHVIRNPAGEWQVMLQFSHEVGLPVPGAAADDSAAIRWQPVLDPPKTYRVGDEVQDGWELTKVTATAVELARPDSDADPIVLELATETTPGEFSWDVRRIKAEDS
ncbi:MAG: hypothetical protein OXC63_08385 [Aestuariivita sp.]|nr:hypothetical protein [Aestuariivita sp.]MCY4345409.1 hypothetical protein [Aestuariivita sp.]